MGFTGEMEEALTDTLPDVEEEILRMDDVVNSFKILYENCLIMLENRLYNKTMSYFNDLYNKGSWYHKYVVLRTEIIII